LELVWVSERLATVIFTSLTAELVVAFSAGVFSLLSPCNFPLLPAYIAYMFGRKASAKEAILSGALFTLGLMTVFCGLGVGLSALGGLVMQYVPWVNLVVAIIIVVLGLVILFDLPLPYFTAPMRLVGGRGIGRTYLFGVVYGLAISGCTAPIFIAILLHSMISGPVQSVLVFITYALGMGTVTVTTNLLLARAKVLLVRKVARLTPWLHKVSGLGLVAIGGYLFYTLVLM
jgi:cytochrome c-type biogenesis protein